MNDITELEEQIGAQSNLIDELNETIAELNLQLNSSREETSNVHAELRIANRAIEELEDDVSNMQWERDEQSERADVLEEVNNELEESLGSALAKLKAANQRIDHLELDVETTTVQIDKLVGLLNKSTELVEKMTVLVEVDDAATQTS